MPSDPFLKRMAEPRKKDAWGQAAEEFYGFHARGKAAGRFSRAFIQSYRRLAERFPLTAGSEFLDAGCGTGELAESLQQTKVHFTGIDISEESLRFARMRPVRAEFRHASMTEMPFAEAHFDAAAAITSLEFCEDKRAALSELRRVLKPGGFLYAEVRNADFLLCRLPGPLVKTLEKCGLLTAYPAEGYRDLSHAEWTGLFQEAGFHVEREFSSLRPWNYGNILTRMKNLMIEGAKIFFPARRQYMTAFLLRSAVV